MILRSQPFQGYTNAQSSLIGWKEIHCSKSTNATSQQLNMITLTIASGSPEFYFFTFNDEYVSSGNGGLAGNIHRIRGWKSAADGTLSIPGGAIDIVASANGNWSSNTPWPNYTLSTRTINFRAISVDVSVTNTQCYLSVFSERIDLITLTCV